ncbi:MAG: sodium/solute symporter [Gemmatimonadetes bacterium]|nr:sodium/solute symporter [Gemmatimonadota bacterium]
MNLLDLALLGIYLATVLGASLIFARRQRSTDDYYVGGRRLASGWIALSILATQVSAISLLGGPAFVALQPQGGLVWLQYELAVPLAMLAALMVLVPVLRRARVVTVYEYVEARFGGGARMALALVFLLARGLATGVALYAVALPLALAFHIPLAAAMIGIGGFAILYTTIGGIKADVFSDALQLVVLVGVMIVLVAEAAAGLGGWRAALGALPAERAQVLVWSEHGLGDGQTFALWPMLIGGFFLYLSYYGVDQSQAQRYLSTGDVPAAQRALLWNGLFRFPVAALYCLLGLLLAGWLQARPEFAAAAALDRPDALVPRFVLDYAPAGVRGLFIAGLLAAAMSTLDSAYNSLSAVTLRDVLGWREQSAARLRAARALTLLWGVVCTAASFLFARSSRTVIETVNQVGSLFYGPILALFILGMLFRRPGGVAALGGLVAGLAANAALWRLAPGVSWMWWNAIGFGISLLAGLALGTLSRAVAVPAELLWTPTPAQWQRPPLRRDYAAWLLVLAFLGIMLVALLAPIAFRI